MRREMLMLEEIRKERMLAMQEPDEEFEDNDDPLAEFGYEPI